MSPDRDYDLFVRIVEAGSLSAAGRLVRLSPAMVSKRLARLEARLGVRLIHRTTRRLELTERGARFYDDALAILNSIAAAETRLGGTSDVPSGVFRISAPTSFGRLHIAPLLGQFIADFPRVHMEIELSDGFIDLLADRIDLAIRITSNIDKGLDAERITSSRRILCAAPAYLAVHGKLETISDLPRHRLLAARGQLPWLLSDGGREISIGGESIVGTNSSEVVRELALTGVGVALRSLWDVGAELRAGRLIRVLPEVEGSHDVGIFAAQTPSTQPSPTIAAFVKLLRATFQPIPPWEQTIGD